MYAIPQIAITQIQNNTVDYKNEVFLQIILIMCTYKCKTLIMYIVLGKISSWNPLHHKIRSINNGFVNSTKVYFIKTSYLHFCITN